jgi:hypothetical protein
MGNGLDETNIMTALNRGRDLMGNKEYSKALRAIMEVGSLWPRGPVHMIFADFGVQRL